MKTQDLRTNDVKKEIKDGIETFIYKDIEIDKSTAVSCEDIEDIEEDDENYVRAYATNIQWDTKCGDEFDDDIVEYLPSRVEIPFYITDDEIADMLSDEYGYCVISFEIEQC